MNKFNKQIPLTGGMMIIVIPGRKGSFIKMDDQRTYAQQSTQMIINLSDDVIQHWAYQPLKDEIEIRRNQDGTFRDFVMLKHSIQKRLQHWLEDHVIAICGSNCIDFNACTWSFNHNQA